MTSQPLDLAQIVVTPVRDTQGMTVTQELVKNGGATGNGMEKLLLLAQMAAERAYAPYSNLHIGAAVLTEDGNIFCGCNVENASYGLTWCAERTAIVSAVAAEGPKMRVRAVAIWTPDLAASPPCGACRQVLAEFGSDALVAFTVNGELVERTVHELLPGAFNLAG